MSDQGSGQSLAMSKHGHDCMHRRAFLSGLAATAALLPMPSEARRLSAPHRIDVHYHHIAPDWIRDPAVAQAMAPQVRTIARDWTPQRGIEEMDRNGVATAVCSVSNPGVWFGDVAQGRRLARVCNEYAARMAGDHPGRYRSFATLPLPDAEGSVREIAYALDVLKADGIALFTSYGDKWLADPAFAPVMEEINRRRAVVYVHPMAPTCCRGLVAGIPAALIEYPVDTSRAMLQWAMTDSSKRFPGIRLIFSHAGGLTMGGLGRLQLLSDTHPEFGLPKSFRQEFSNFFYELSSSADQVTLAALRSYVPLSHILLGTDSPFIGPMAPNIAQLTRLGLPKRELKRIERDNALRLMPSLG